jgi:TolB-like protein
VQNANLASLDPAPRRIPTAKDVQCELERILVSRHLQPSERRRAFLRYVVEETLSGRSDRLKGYSVAVAVFGRDETFDSQSDPVVRLEARRLRRDLDSYYVDDGRHDPVRITIPKGSYVPHFEWHEVGRPRAPAGIDRAEDAGAPSLEEASGRLDGPTGTGRVSTRLMLAGALIAILLALVVAGGLFLFWDEPQTSLDDLRGPAVVVVPFEPLSSTEDSRYLAEGISQELISDLMRFPGFRLYTLPIGFEGGAHSEPVTLGHDLGVAYVASGSVRSESENVHVSAQLLDAATGQVLWTRTYERPLTPQALIGVQSDLAAEIATELGQPYGIVNTDLNLRSSTPAVANIQSYMCVLRAYSYRRGFSRDEFAPVLNCLEETVRRDPDYSDAWAMLGWLHLDAGRFEFAGHKNLQDEYEAAFESASRAVLLDPNNIMALKALSSINHYMGHYDEGERLARRAADLNPNDPDTLAQLGWRLAVRGKFDEGIPILTHAIERTVNPPGWYFHLIAIDLYLKGDYRKMLQVAERSAADGSPVSQALIAIADGELGDQAGVREALEKMSGYAPMARDPAAFFRRNGATDEIVDALVSGLEKARGIASNP